jgi:hypothetical protein
MHSIVVLVLLIDLMIDHDKPLDVARRSGVHPRLGPHVIRGRCNECLTYLAEFACDAELIWINRLARVEPNKLKLSSQEDVLWDLSKIKLGRRWDKHRTQLHNLKD